MTTECFQNDSRCGCMLFGIPKSRSRSHAMMFHSFLVLRHYFMTLNSVFTADSKTCRERVHILFFSLTVKSLMSEQMTLCTWLIESGLTMAAIFWHLIHFIHFCPNIWNPISRRDLGGMQCNVFSQHPITWYKF